MEVRVRPTLGGVFKTMLGGLGASTAIGVYLLLTAFPRGLQAGGAHATLAIALGAIMAGLGLVGLAVIGLTYRNGALFADATEWGWIGPFGDRHAWARSAAKRAYKVVPAGRRGGEARFVVVGEGGRVLVDRGQAGWPADGVDRWLAAVGVPVEQVSALPA